MNFTFSWLFGRWLGEKLTGKTYTEHQAVLDKAVRELGQSKVVAELAERDPKLKENLRTLGVKIPDDDNT